jgi:hypothetical protein
MKIIQWTGTLFLAVLGLGASALPSAASTPNCPSTSRIAVGVAPPPRLRIERQPPIPAYGDVWAPGYWAWNRDINNYDWAPGLWVRPPRIGVLWTPPYWSLNQGVYLFTQGYWGPSVGYYGGVNYGYGYGSQGYNGGYWRDRTFYYNRMANNFGDLRFNAVYSQPIYYDRRARGYSYELAGRGGQARYVQTYGRSFEYGDGGDRHDHGRGHAYGRLGGGPGHSDHGDGEKRDRSEGHDGGEHGRGHEHGHGHGRDD